MLDSHCHLNDPKFNGELDQIVANFLSAGVTNAVCVGCSPESNRLAKEIAHSYDSVYYAVGVHPDDCDLYDEQDLEKFLSSKDKKLVAVGEIGLDYYRIKDNKDKQKQVFISQIRLAKKYDLPIIIHCRDSYGDTLEVLKEFAPFNGKAVVHCFSGSLEFARELFKLGINISFTGSVTFENAKNLHNVVMNIPNENFFFETDSPYLAPTPHRGKRNEPKYVAEIVKFVAGLRGETVEELEKITDQNAKRFFNLL